VSNPTLIESLQLFPNLDAHILPLELFKRFAYQGIIKLLFGETYVQ
jgi:hypothetical protein